MTTTVPTVNADGTKEDKAEIDTKRVDYLFECYRVANEETFQRFKHREHWLEIQLFVQVVLFALSEGVTIAGISAGNGIPQALALSPAISLVLVSLYYVDDSIITYIGNYIGALSDAEAKLRPGAWTILNWNASDQVTHYVSQALPLKYLAQLVAFAVIPAGLVARRIQGFASWGITESFEVAIHAVFLLIIAYVVWQGFRARSNAYFKSRAGVLIPKPPDNQL